MHSWLDIGSRHQMLVVSQVVTMRIQSVCAWMAQLPLLGLGATRELRWTSWTPGWGSWWVGLSCLAFRTLHRTNRESELAVYSSHVPRHIADVRGLFECFAWGVPLYYSGTGLWSETRAPVGVISTD